MSNLLSYKFQGHQAPVLCLDFRDEHLLASGSEDRTARLWDVRDDRRRACLCIPVPGEVLSVQFVPKREEHSMRKVDLQNNPFAKDHTICLSMEHVVLEYDLRMAQGPILSTPTRDLSTILQNQDEVNQLAMAYFQKPNNKKNKKGKTVKTPGGESLLELYLAAADDAGTIRFMEWQSTQSQILHHDPNGVAVVPTCAFRPGSSKSLELASGGTDCKIHLWDLMKPKRPISSYTIQQPESGDTNKPQVCNPPMVYSLAWSPSGRLLAAGLGDGNIPIFSIDNRNLVQMAYLPDGHDSSVASVIFPHFGGRTNERLVVSGGSDGSILCWDIGPNVVMEELDNDDNADPKEMFVSDFFLGGDDSNTNQMADDEQLATKTKELSFGNKPKILFGIPHNTKVNWMTTSEQCIFVADTSPDITAYKLPLR